MKDWRKLQLIRFNIKQAIMIMNSWAMMTLGMAVVSSVCQL